MKKCLLLLMAALLILPVFASAESAPVNPMASIPPSRHVYTVGTAATQAPTKAPDSGSTAGTSEADAFAAYADEILSPEIVAQLDSEVIDYLNGTGKLLDTVDGIRNILIVGVDARPGETRSRSDTVIILTIDGNNNAIRLTSLLRDLYVHIPGHGNNRFNAAWVYGEFDLLRDTIKENFGLDVSEYVTVDMTLLADLIDQIGGLTLTVESQKQLKAINGVIDAYNYQFRQPVNDGLLTELGEQHMNGKQVQAYARYRKIDSDFQRSERQRQVLSLVFDKLQSMSIIELSRLAAYAIDRVKTNLSLSDIISLIPVMYHMKDADISQLTLPHTGEYKSKTISGMDVLVPDLAAAQERLGNFIYGR